MKANSPKEPVTVFLADDNEDDWYHITLAFRQCCDWNVHPVASGDELIDRLSMLDVRTSSRPDERFATGKTPFRFLVMLDLHLQGDTGLETLSQLKARREYRMIPVIVFGRSASTEELEQAYDLGANAVIEKPASYPDLVHTIRVLYGFWSEFVHVPYFDRARR